MKYKRLFFLIIPLVLLTGIFFTGQSFARSGCCSWHGGVCGNQCCDGTPLSSLCGGDLFIPLYTQPSTGTYDNGQALQWCGAGKFFSTKQEADNSLSAYKSIIETPLTSQINDLTSQLSVARDRLIVIFILLGASLFSTFLGYKYKQLRIVTFFLFLIGFLIMIA